MEQYELEELIIHLIDEDDFDSAFDYLEEYLTGYGANEFYYFSLSDIYLAHKDYENTIELMDSALEDGIENDLLYERYGDAFYGLQNYELALQWFLKCDLKDDNPNLLHTVYMIGLCYFLLEDYKDAIQYFEDVLLEIESQEAFYNCAVAYLYVNKPKRACEYFDKVFANPQLQKPICLELISHGCIEQGKSFFNRLGEPDEYLFNCWCSDFYASVSSYDISLKYLYNAYELRPSDSLKCQIADYHAMNNEEETSYRLYQEVLDSTVNFDASQFEFIYAKMNAMKHICDVDMQLSYLKSFEVYAENDCSIYMALLNYSLDQKLFDYQDHLMFDCTFIEPTDQRLQEALNDLFVLVHFNHGRFQDALDLLSFMKYRQDSFYYRNLVIAHYNLEQYDQAVQYYDEVMPDGKFAIMMLDSFIKLEDEDGFDRVLEDMEDVNVNNIQDFYDVLASILPTE